MTTPVGAAVIAQTSTVTSATSVATDGLGGFTLGAALLAVLVGGYYLLRRRRARQNPPAE